MKAILDSIVIVSMALLFIVGVFFFLLIQLAAIILCMLFNFVLAIVNILVAIWEKMRCV